MNVVFRVDASRQIGAGHLIRCLALADALQAHGASCRFVCRELTETLAALIAGRGHGVLRITPSEITNVVQDARATAAAIRRDELCDWLVVDHYGLDAVWEASLRAVATRVLVIDDLANRPHECELLLDQGFTPASSYRGMLPERCRLLLGPRYALLREEFRLARHTVAPRLGAARRLLVAFGGTDGGNHTGAVVAALAGIPSASLHVDVVIGAEHEQRATIEQGCARLGFSLHVQPKRLADLMAAADLAIGAGGSTTWERCCLGVPSLVYAVADNQRQLVHEAALQGLLYAPNPPLAVAATLEVHVQALLDNSLLREVLSRNGMSAVDGRGVHRVVREMGLSTVSVRPACADDATRVFDWRNQPLVRESSRSPDPIDWQGHQAWFADVLADSQRVMLIGEASRGAVGVVRFDVTKDDAQVSIYMVPDRDGAVSGADLLAAAEQWLAKNRPEVRHLRASVLAGNLASQRLFTGAGYGDLYTQYAKRIA